MKKFQSLIFTFILAFSFVATGPVGCKATLEEGGAYNVEGQPPDKSFYVADLSFDLAFTTVDKVFTFERDNRLALWRLSPDIKRTLDKFRPQAKQIAVEWSVARKAYKANPTPEGLTKLQTILGRMQQVSAAVGTVLPKQ